MSRNGHRIDNELLISLIEDKPVLWDKTFHVFKDRIATKNAWREVCEALRTDFHDLNEEERTNFGKEVLKRWKHLRDAFAKAEKRDRDCQVSGSQAKKRRMYLFYEELQFLKKIYENVERPERFTDEDNDAETDWDSQQPPVKIECEVGLETSRVTEREQSENQPERKNIETDEIDLKILKMLEKIETQNPNPQSSFYQSLLTHTEKFDSDEWLQFQMEVLRVISNIKKKKSLL